MAKATVREQRRAELPKSKIQVYYTKSGALSLDYGRNSEGTIVPFTKAAAEKIDPDLKPLRRKNGTIVGRISLSDKKPFLTIDRSDTELVEALQNSEFCEGSPYAAFQPLFRVIDPDKIEAEKVRAFDDVKRASHAYFMLTNDKEEFMLLADAFDVRKKEGDLLMHFKEMAEKKPKEFLSYVEDKGDHTFVLTEKLRVDAILRRAIRAKIVKEAGGILVYRNEKLGKDFKEASVALRDNRPQSGKSEFLTLIKEDLENVQK
jgi:hypothetical protein